MWWRTRDSMSHVSQWSDSQQNQGISEISLLFQILIVVTIDQNANLPLKVCQSIPNVCSSQCLMPKQSEISEKFFYKKESFSDFKYFPFYFSSFVLFIIFIYTFEWDALVNSHQTLMRRQHFVLNCRVLISFQILVQ